MPNIAVKNLTPLPSLPKEWSWSWAGFPVRSKIFRVSVLVALMLGALLISLLVFSKQSLRLDEAQSLWQSSHNPVAIMQVIAQDVHVPLYPLILHFWQMLFGNSVTTARLLSLSFFLASIPAVYFLGKKIYGPGIGLFTALLVAISPFLNWYGNETRMYSLLTLLTILNQYFFVSLFHRQRAWNSKNQLDRIWLGYFITAFLGIYTHYFFFMVLLTQAVFFLFYRRLFPVKALKKFARVMGLLAILFLPWALYVLRVHMLGNSTPLLSKPTSINLFNTFSQFVFGFQDDHLNTLIVSLWPLSVLFAFLTLRKNNRPNPTSVYLFLAAILPVALAFVISVIAMPLFLTRYLILAIPALYLFITKSLTVYPPRLSLSLKILLVVGMLFTLGHEAFSSSTPVKENYQQAAQYLNSHTNPQDIIAVSAPFTVYPIEYYYHGSAAITTIPDWNRFVVGPIPQFSIEQLNQQVSVLRTSHQNLWLLLSYDQGYQNQVKLYFDTHFQKLAAMNFSPGLDLYEYKLKYNDVSFDDIMTTLYSHAQAPK